MIPRVLLVEDSPTQAEYYKVVLEGFGLEVWIAGDGPEALEIAYREHPDLIVLDVNLPSMDGFQVCKRLSRSAETSDIPIVMLTERDSADDAWAGLESGAIDYIAKDNFADGTLQASLEQLGIVTE